jgi:cold shock protein
LAPDKLTGSTIRILIFREGKAMPFGKIKMFREEKGYGFITCDAGSDVFFHVSALAEGDDISPGVAVSFTTGVDKKTGKVRAVSVDLV